MSKCPNCNYELVLLEHRLKYKCPKCSKLFAKIEIERRDFVEFNKRERKADKEKFYGKPHKQKQLTEFEKKQRASAYCKSWYERNKEKVYEYYMRNRDKIIQQKREYRKGLSGQRKKLDNERRNALRHQNNEGTRLNSRIWHLRQRQKYLAVQKIEFEYYRALESKIKEVLPTISLSYLL